MELMEPYAFSDLVGVPVRNQAGQSLGRVFEVRAHMTRNGSIVFDELLVGKHGLLRRLRGPGPDSRGVPWEAVTEIGPDRILVR